MKVELANIKLDLQKSLLEKVNFKDEDKRALTKNMVHLGDGAKNEVGSN